MKRQEMSCQEIEERLLEEGTNIMDSCILTHLHRCVQCGDLYDDLAALEQLNRGLRHGVKAPPDFYSQMARSYLSGSSQARLLLGGLAFVLLIVIGGGVVPSESIHAQVARQAISAAVGARQQNNFRETTHRHSSDEAYHIWVRSDQQPEFPYVEFSVESASGVPVRVRLPSTVEVSIRELHHELYWRRVSY